MIYIYIHTNNCLYKIQQIIIQNKYKYKITKIIHFKTYLDNPESRTTFLPPDKCFLTPSCPHLGTNNF